VTEQSAGRGAEQAVEQQVPKAEKVVPDDLTVIKGIGLAVQEKLRSLGITTLRDLATADPDDMVYQLKASLPVSKARVRGWIEAARGRTRARE
jgi:predicted flap endonuclease-1-like 5' DNA nuclease